MKVYPTLKCGISNSNQTLSFTCLVQAVGRDYTGNQRRLGGEREKEEKVVL
jgi:hypothetical protein